MQEVMVAEAKGNDFRKLTPVLDLVKSRYEWIQMEHVLADRGYDSLNNNLDVIERGASPVIGIRNTLKDGLLEGVYTFDGIPTCMGLKPMEYARSDPKLGHLYRCDRDGCDLRERKGVRYCHDEIWENRKDNPRVWPPIRRGSPEWKRMYGKRWSVESVFKSMQESGRLGVHYIRLQVKISLLCLVASLVFVARALVRVRAGEQEYMRWQVRRVA